jgi:ATP-independent RNA helicase DbpA
MIETLNNLGYHSMTEIQSKSLPLVLQGADVVAKAKTGSGKTAAFALGMLERLEASSFSVQGLVLCPTRELCTQVATEIRKLARYKGNIKVLLLCGGQSIGPQIGSLEHGAHIIVGTPGRIQDHLRKQTLTLSKVKTVVLDEADRMLDMGFSEAVQQIVNQTPSSRQTLLFSATYPDSIEQLTSKIMHQPEIISVESVHSESNIEQLFVRSSRNGKDDLLLQLLQHYQPASTVIFCNTKVQCKEVCRLIKQHGGSAEALHGDLEQRDRDKVLVRFSQSSCSVLVATDVAARGIDIADLSMVVNYDVPRDPEIYIHRVGRTGRAGKSGLALSIYSESEGYKVEAIEDYRKQPTVYLDPDTLDANKPLPLPAWVSLEIAGGRKDKIRPGDLLGALTANQLLTGKAVGNIAIFDRVSYVAVAEADAKLALKQLTAGKVKGRKVMARIAK